MQPFTRRNTPRKSVDAGFHTTFYSIWAFTLYAFASVNFYAVSCTHFLRRHVLKHCWGLEAQQRYLSYRAMLVAIVSQNSFVLVFMGHRAIIVRYVAKWGIAQLSRDTLQNGVSHRCACVKLSAWGGVSHHFGWVLTSLKKYRAIWGIAAIVSQYRAIWGH